MEQPNNKPDPKAKHISQLIGFPWGFKTSKDEFVSTDPSPEEVENALKNKEFESRGFDSHKAELEKEWNDGLPSTYPHREIEYARRTRTYHARRMAHLVEYGWEGFPIVVKEDGRTINDGLHRWKAACWKAAYRNGPVEVEIKIAGEL